MVSNYNFLSFIYNMNKIHIFSNLHYGRWPLLKSINYSKISYPVFDNYSINIRVFIR